MLHFNSTGSKQNDAFKIRLSDMHSACRDVETLPQDVSAEKAMEALKCSKRKSLPVVDANGNLVSFSCITAPQFTSSSRHSPSEQPGVLAMHLGTS